MYMFFGTGSTNSRSILKAEVELAVFLRMRSDKITKNGKNSPKMHFDFLISRMYMFFGTRNPNLRSILEPEVELMVFLRKRNKKKSRKTAKNAPKMWFEGLISRVYMFFGTVNPNLMSTLNRK